MKALTDWPLPDEISKQILALKGDKIRTFVIEYARDHNGTRAARDAGYSPKIASVQANRLLAKDKVIECIEAIEAWRRRLFILEGKEVIQELSRVATAKITDVASWTASSVTLKDSSELNDNQIAAIAEVVQTKEGVRIKMHSKVQALDLLGKHFGLFVEDKRGATPLDQKLSQLIDEIMLRLRDAPAHPHAPRPPVPIGHSAPK